MKRIQAVKDLNKSSPCIKLLGMVHFHDVGMAQIKATAAPVQLLWKKDAKRAELQSQENKEHHIAETLFFD